MTFRHQLYVVSVLIFFAGSSLGAIFINKTCLTGYNFRYPLTLVLGQMIFAVSILSILHVSNYRPLPRANRAHLLTLAFPTALFTSNVVVGLSALSLVNIPMFSAFRRLTLLFVMTAEYLLLRKKHSRQIVHTVVIMTIGAFISAVDDVSFSRVGYCLVFLNNVLTAAYLASIKRAIKETRFDALTLLYYTALLGLPMVVLLVISTGEIEQVMVAFRTRPELVSWGFVVSILLTTTGAFAVNVSTSVCTDVTSPLTTSVAGQVKNVLQTMLGFFSWGFVPTRMNILGLLIALGAQVWFAYLKYVEFEEKKRQEDGMRGTCGFQMAKKVASGDAGVVGEGYAHEDEGATVDGDDADGDGDGDGDEAEAEDEAEEDAKKQAGDDEVVELLNREPRGSQRRGRVRGAREGEERVHG